MANERLINQLGSGVDVFNKRKTPCQVTKMKRVVADMAGHLNALGENVTETTRLIYECVMKGMSPSEIKTAYANLANTKSAGVDTL